MIALGACTLGMYRSGSLRAFRAHYAGYEGTGIEKDFDDDEGGPRLWGAEAEEPLWVMS